MNTKTHLIVLAGAGVAFIALIVLNFAFVDAGRLAASSAVQVAEQGNPIGVHLVEQPAAGHQGEENHEYDPALDGEEPPLHGDEAEQLAVAAAAPVQEKPAETRAEEPAAVVPEEPAPNAAPEPPVPVVKELPSSSMAVRCSSSDKPVELSDGGKIRYGAEALIDGQLDVAWVEGVEGHGIGEWVELVLDRPYRLDRIEVWNGYQKVRNDNLGDRYVINERVKDLEVDMGGRVPQQHRLEDKRAPQTIALGGVVSDRIRIEILSVYEARFPDAAISEVKLHVSLVSDEGSSTAHEQAARDTLDAWLEAQNKGDFNAYAGMYAARFEGIKRAGDKKNEFDTGGWLDDRKGMFKRAMKVSAEDVSFSPHGDGIRIRFLQRWSSGKYKDRGEKEMDIVLEGDVWRIAREEMLYSIVEK